MNRGYKAMVKDTCEFDPSWPHGHVTRDGRKARILCADLRDRPSIRGARYPVIARVEREDGTEQLRTFTERGKQFAFKESSDGDLFNAPAPKQKFETWVALRRYPDSNVVEQEFSCSRAGAKHWAYARGCQPIALKRVTFEEGEGLAEDGAS